MKFEKFNDVDAQYEFAKSIEEESHKYNALQSLLAGEQLGQEQIESLQEFAPVKKFFESEIGDESELTLKKVVAAAIIAADELGVLPFKIGKKNAVDIASVIDEGLTRAKLAYKQATGNLESEEVADKLIDAATVRLITVVDKVVEHGLPVVAEKLAMAVAAVYPPAECVVPYVKVIAELATPLIKEQVNAGIKKLAERAKPIVHKAISDIKETVKAFVAKKISKLVLA